MCLAFLLLGPLHAAAPVGSQEALVALYQEFRAFAAPAMDQGVPDYSEKAMAAKSVGLAELQRRILAIDTTGWEVAARVDYATVRTEMNAMDFQLRVLRPWRKDPAFYAVINFQFGPKIHGAIEPPVFPLALEKVAAFQTQLRAVPKIFAQAKINLTDARADLAMLGIRTANTEAELFAAMSEPVERSHPELLGDVRAARAAAEDFAAWLAANQGKMLGPSGIGEAECDWYLRNVLLLPYSWRDLAAISHREYGRAIALLRIEENRNRKLPPMKVANTLEESTALLADARKTIIEFVQREEIMTLPSFPPPSDPASEFNRPEPRDYFQHFLDRDPVPLIPHSMLGHNPDERRQLTDQRPIRGMSRLFFSDGIRAEALATGMEQFLMHAGILDARPRSRELSHNLWAFRAARSTADLNMQANKVAFAEAFQFVIDRTPNNWAPQDSPTLWHDLELYLRQPLYGIGYMIGLIEIENLLGESAEQLGERFKLSTFMDEFIAKGMVPIELIRWEMTGKHERIGAIFPEAVRGLPEN
jgi:hypothetical protein